jgi:predicted nucleic acid-binding protein
VSFLPVYLDTSAILKLIVVEPESEALLQALDSRADRVSSVLASVEVHRSLRRLRAPRAARERAAAILSAVVMVRVDDPVLERASAFEDATLRALDAVHLATALSLGDDPDAFFTYDRRLARAAAALGLAVLHPGVVQLT